MDNMSRKLAELALPFTLDVRTPGDGNCFFHAICQQLQRPELAISMNSMDHVTLRQNICDFALTAAEGALVRYKLRYQVVVALTGGDNWDSFFNRMRTVATWADGPVATVTCWFLQRDILIISEGNTISNPYLHLPDSDRYSAFPPLLLWNSADHYQSLLPQRQLCAFGAADDVDFTVDREVIVVGVNQGRNCGDVKIEDRKEVDVAGKGKQVDEVSIVSHAVIGEVPKESVLEESASAKNMAKQAEDKKAAKREKARLQTAAKRAAQTKEQREAANEKEKIRKRNAAEGKGVNPGKKRRCSAAGDDKYVSDKGGNKGATAEEGTSTSTTHKPDSTSLPKDSQLCSMTMKDTPKEKKEEKLDKRQKERLRLAVKRAAQTKEERAEANEKEKLRKRRKTLEDKAVKEKKKASMASLRSQQSAEQKAEEAAKKRDAMERLRSQQTADQKAEETARARDGMERLRSQQTADQKAEETAKARDGMETLRSQQTPQQQSQAQQSARVGMADVRVRRQQSEAEMLSEASAMSMTDPSILDSDGFKLVEGKFQSAIESGPTYICQVCLKFEYRSNVVTADASKYDDDLYMRCSSDRSEHICKSCHRSLLNGKVPVQAQANGLQLNPSIPELSDLCPLEHLLISQVIPFMFVIARHKGAQSGLKGQVVLVPADLQKIHSVLPRTTNDDHIISIALKRRLTDKSSFSKQHIRPALVNRALQKLMDINHLYQNVIITDDWQEISEQSDPEIWKMLTEPGVGGGADPDAALYDSDEEGDTVAQTRNILPTAMHTIDEPTIDSNQVVDIAPGEGQIPVSYMSEPNWEPLAFARHFSHGTCHFSERRDRYISPIKYVHARLKSSDERFAADPQYTFQCLEWVEKTVIAGNIYFAERKQKDMCRKVRDIRDQSNVRRLMSENEIHACFKSLRGSPQYFHNMALDVMAKIRMFGPQTFFITFSAAEFSWTDIIKTVAAQFQEVLTDDDVNNMDWQTKVSYLKRNPVTVARQIDHRFQQLWGKVLMSGLHPIGQILNYDARDEYQARGTQHIHAVVHVKDAPKLDEATDEVVVEFIDKYVTCALPEHTTRPHLHDLVKKVQTHHHTQTCRKKAGVKCRFHFPSPPTEKTTVVRPATQPSKTEVKRAHKMVNEVLEKMVAVGDLSSITEEELLNAAQISKRDYYESLALIKQKTTILYKRNPCETSVSPYNTVLLQLWQANMNIQFVTGIHGVVAYLTSYLCKPEAGMSELMKKACKDAAGTGAKEQLQAIGHVFRKHREVSQHEAIARTLSFHFRNSNVPVKYVPTGPKKNRTRMLKSKSALDAMDDDDENIYALSILERYEKRPDELEDMCLADFASNYEYSKEAEEETVRSYFDPVAAYDANEVIPAGNATIIKLKDGLGSMRKRNAPCVLRWHSVSKLKDAEGYFLRMLQLYLPWRNEDDLLHHTGNYETMFVEVEDAIRDKIRQYERYEDLDFDDLQVVGRLYSDNEDDADDADILLAADPALLEHDFVPDDPIPRDPNTAARVRDFLLPNAMLYEMCSQFNEKQRQLFNYVLTHVMQTKWLPTPERPAPFFVFLSGGGGVGKSFLITAIAETLKRVLKHAGQTFDQPSICITASTGKAAVGICGITLHSAFALPVTGAGQSRKISDERLQSMRLKYHFLQYLIVDEISMVGYYTFEDLDRHLKSIKENDESFGGVSIIAGGDFFQLPPVKQSYVFTDPKGDAYHVLVGCLWKQLFYLHELTEIVRQAGDPHFAEILSRVREGLHDDADITELMALNDTDMSNWPVGGCMHIYLTNDLAARENARAINLLPSEKKIVTAKDSTTDLETGSCAVTVPDAWPITKTGNLCKKLVVAVGCRVMLTVNVDIEDRLINGSLGTVIRIELGSVELSGTIYVKFDDDKAGDSKKNRRLPDELKDCVPVKAHCIRFPMSHRNKTIMVQRKQFPVVLGHAITSHKSQGSTYEYMVACMDRTPKQGSRLTPVLPGQAYTMLSRAKCRTAIKLMHFNSRLILTNKNALQEMKRMREHRTLDCNIPIPDGSYLLWNVRRAWHMHIPHLLTDEMYARCCDLMCFTETNVTDVNNVAVFNADWSELHVMSAHGLALCYKKDRVTVVTQYVVNPSLEAIAVLLEHCGSNVVVLLLYRKPGALLNFIACLNDQLRILTEEMPPNCRLICMGDFNLDQRDPNNVALLSGLQHTYGLHQRSRFTSHADGGILDLWLDTHLHSQAVSWIPTPFSDHFILLST